MNEQLRKLRDRINALTLRERSLLMITILAVFFGIWYVAIYQPMSDAAVLASHQLKQSQANFARTTRKIQALLARNQGSPDANAKKQLAQLDRQIAKAGRQLTALTRGLIPPRQMASVLRALLAQQGHLRLDQVTNVAPSPLLKAPKTKQVLLYKQTLILNFQGSYPDTLAYLRSIERQPWHLFWDALTIDTNDYPREKVQLRVHTLSLSKAWLGG